MNSLTKEQQESYKTAQICFICKENFETKYLKDKNYRKVRDYCHYTGELRGPADSICNLRFSVPQKNPIAFHNDQTMLSVYHKRVNRRI